MNLVLDDAEEVHMKSKNRKPLGKDKLRILHLYITLSMPIALVNKHYWFCKGTSCKEGNYVQMQFEYFLLLQCIRFFGQ